MTRTMCSYGPDWERQHRGGPGPEPRPGLLIRAEHNGLGGHRVIEHRGVQRAVHRARQRPSPGHHRLDCMKDPVRPIRGRQPPPIRQRRARGPGDRARFAAYAARWPARPKSLRRNAPPMIATTSVSPRSPGMTVTPGIGWSGPWVDGRIHRIRRLDNFVGVETVVLAEPVGATGTPVGTPSLTPLGTVNPGMPSSATASIGLCAVENLAEHLWTLLVIVDGKWPLPGRRCDEDRGAGTTATPAGSGRGDRTPRKGAQVELQCHAEPGPIAVLTFWSPNCSICWASRTGPP